MSDDRGGAVELGLGRPVALDNILEEGNACLCIVAVKELKDKHAVEMET